MNLSPTEAALKRARDKIIQGSSGEILEKVTTPFDDGPLPEIFPDSPKERLPGEIKEIETSEPGPDEKPPEREPEEEPPAPIPLDGKLSFVCSIHGEQSLVEMRYMAVVLKCGCEWVYDCGYLTQIRRGPGE